MFELIFLYWGKASKKEERIARHHLLVFHCLDVAAVAAYWWDNSPALRRSLMRDGDNEKQLRAWLLFFIALHDLGKTDVRFQLIAPHAWQALNPEKSAWRYPSSHRYQHGPGGVWWFYHDFNLREDNEDDALFTGLAQEAHPRKAWLPWIEATAGHHGIIATSGHVSRSSHYALPTELRTCQRQDSAARQQLTDALAELFLQPAGLDCNATPPDVPALLAGFCSICDWLGSWSTEDTFGYRHQPQSLQSYFDEKYQSDAPRVLARSGILPQPKACQGLSALLPEACTPRPFQLLVDDLPVQNGLTLIEAATGSGKTEAALAYAWKLLAAGIADSIIFALPTQATTNAMLARIERIASLFFLRPNIILAHGSARFNDNFKQIKQRSETAQQEQDGLAECCRWLASSKKRAFLGQIGVCTIDQVLTSVLPLQHYFVREFGLGRSVLIVDEVHAYDAWMNTLLAEVLRNQRHARGSAILLSATLPCGQKQRLLAAWDAAAEQPSPGEQRYPLITWQQDIRQHYSLTQPGDYIELFLTPRYLPDAIADDYLLDEMIQAAQQGAQVAIICNLVDVAQSVYRRLQARSEVTILLFHARYTLTDRKEKEAEILVATQVVEQSLDLNFDWLITQHCPVDLLFQRLGRLHRHNTWRPDCCQQRRALVLLPQGEGYGRSQYIYANTLVMWRTQRRIEQLQEMPLVFPQAYRHWIEPVYHPELTGEEPAWVQKEYKEWQRLNESSQLAASMLIKDKDERASLLGDGEVQLRAVTREGEMGLTVVPFIALASGRKLLDGRILEMLPKYDQEEAVMLNQVNIPRWWTNTSAQLEDDNGILWLSGQEDNDSWHCHHGKQLFVYSKTYGMTQTGSGTDNS